MEGNSIECCFGDACVPALCFVREVKLAKLLL